jgi:hypothetical protein
VNAGERDRKAEERKEEWRREDIQRDREKQERDALREVTVIFSVIHKSVLTLTVRTRK